MHTPCFSRLSALALLLAFTVGCGATAVQPDGDAGPGENNEAGVAPDTGLRSDAGMSTDLEPTPIPDSDGSVAPADVTITPPRDAGPVTECDPANNGLRCGPPGMGCGGGGGGECGTSFSCNCGRDQRWACTVTVPPGCDGGVAPSDARVPPDDVIAPPQDGGPALVCPVLGAWRARFDSLEIAFTFTPDGRWLGSDAPGAEPIVQGTYTLTGSTLVITGEQSRGGGGGCAMTDRGTYTVQFRPECAAMRLSLVSEDCGGRGETLSMLQFTRP